MVPRTRRGVRTTPPTAPSDSGQSMNSLIRTSSTLTPWLFALALVMTTGCARAGAPASTTPHTTLVVAPHTAPTTVILVRHAEKAPAPAEDPPLDSAGLRRAAMLLDALRDASIDAVYVTQLARTRLTAEPVSTMLGVAPVVVGTTGGTTAHVRAVADRILAEQRGQTTLVVGHSNTVSLIVRALGGSAPAKLEDHEYDNLFIVTIPASGTVTTVRARYGPPNPAPSATPPMR